MKTLSDIQKLSKLGKVLSSIAFTVSVIGLCGCIAGLMSLRFGNGWVMKLGGVTLHGLISAEEGYHIKSVTARLWGWLIACTGEVVLADFARSYFKNELKAGTPFTLAGAGELLRLGILTVAVPASCTVIGGIAGLATVRLSVPKAAVLREALRLPFGIEGSLVLGVMFLLGSLLCRYGAQQQEWQTSAS